MKTAVINGIIPPMITPLTGRKELDTDALYRIVEHMAAGRVNGIFLLGSTGEWANLPVEPRNQVLIHGISAVNGRFPVFVNITDTSISEAVRKAAEAEDAGAGYAVIVPRIRFPAVEYHRTEICDVPAGTLPVSFIRTCGSGITPGQEKDRGKVAG